ncbi:MAG: alpha/beta hydrolase family esterase [Gemmatimonadota bacterium]
MIKPFAVILLTVGISLYGVIPGIGQERLARELARDSLEVDGLTRTFSIYVPPMPPPSPPLLLVLHGGGGDGDRIRQLTGGLIEEEADRYGFIVVYPDGFDRGWNGCRRSAPYRANVENVDDLRFFRALVNRLVESHIVDASRVWVFGFSNGGHLALRLALEAPDDFAAIAAIGASLPIDGELDCVPTGRPASVMIVNGTADPISPFDGGEVRTETAGRMGVVRSTMESALYFAGLSGAPEIPDITIASSSEGSRVEIARWSGSEGREVVLAVIHGGGHSIPGSPAPFPEEVGAVDRGFDSIALAIEFFRRVSD